jgi:hypothetical protein
MSDEGNMEDEGMKDKVQLAGRERGRLRHFCDNQ